MSGRPSTKRELLYERCEDGFQCKKCGKVTDKQNTMSTHVKTKHTYERPHTCEECQEAFVQKSALDSHMRLHAQTEKYSCSLDDASGNDCKVECTTIANLCVHIMRNHFAEDCEKYIKHEDGVFTCVKCSTTQFSSHSGCLYHGYFCYGPGIYEDVE